MHLITTIVAVLAAVSCGRPQEAGSSLYGDRSTPAHYDKHFRNISLEPTKDSPSLFLVRKPCGCEDGEKASLVIASVSCHGRAGSSRAVAYGKGSTAGVKAVCDYAQHTIPSRSPTVDFTCRCTRS